MNILGDDTMAKKPATPAKNKDSKTPAPAKKRKPRSK